jgi:hypothetical protein
MMKCSRTALLAVLALSGGLVASAQADAVRAGFDTNVLAASDDGVFGGFAMGFNVQVGANNTGTAFIHNNGLVDFLGVDPGFYIGTFSFTQALAVFYGDIDTLSAGSGTVSYGTGTVDGHAAWGVTWNQVRHFDSQYGGPTNTFQLVIVDRSDNAAGDFDFEFNYGAMGWDTSTQGSASGIGFTDLNGGNFLMGGSYVSGAFSNGSLEAGSHNSSQAGRYRYYGRNGALIVPLPPAATAGLASLAGVAGLGILRRRKLRQA